MTKVYSYYIKKYTEPVIDEETGEILEPGYTEWWGYNYFNKNKKTCFYKKVEDEEENGVKNNVM